MLSHLDNAPSQSDKTFSLHFNLTSRPRVFPLRSTFALLPSFLRVDVPGRRSPLYLPFLRVGTDCLFVSYDRCDRFFPRKTSINDLWFEVEKFGRVERNLGLSGWWSRCLPECQSLELKASDAAMIVASKCCISLLTDETYHFELR